MTYEILNVKKKDPPKKVVIYHSYAAGFEFVLLKDFEYRYETTTEIRLVKFTKGHKFTSLDYYSNLSTPIWYEEPKAAFRDSEGHIIYIDAFEAIPYGLDFIGWLKFSEETLKDRKRF